MKPNGMSQYNKKSWMVRNVGPVAYAAATSVIGVRRPHYWMGGCRKGRGKGAVCSFTVQWTYFGGKRPVAIHGVFTYDEVEFWAEDLQNAKIRPPRMGIRPLTPIGTIQYRLPDFRQLAHDKIKGAMAYYSMDHLSQFAYAMGRLYNLTPEEELAPCRV